MRSTVLGGLQTSFGGLGGPVGVQRGQGRPGKGWGGPREVPGWSWAGAWKRSFSFCSEVNLSIV